MKKLKILLCFTKKKWQMVYLFILLNSFLQIMFVHGWSLVRHYRRRNQGDGLFGKSIYNHNQPTPPFFSLVKIFDKSSPPPPLVKIFDKSKDISNVICFSFITWIRLNLLRTELTLDRINGLPYWRINENLLFNSRIFLEWIASYNKVALLCGD